MASGYMYPIFSVSYGVSFGASSGGGSGSSGIPEFAGGNFAFSITEDGDPVPYRITTWGLAAQAAAVYQSRNAGNIVFIGNNGYVYKLDPTISTDDGVSIPFTYTTGILPAIEGDIKPEDLEYEKILTRITWVVDDLPPADSQITVMVIDQDDPTNVVERTITQNSKTVVMPIGLRARSWYISWSGAIGGNYNITEFSQDMIIKRAKARVGES